MSSASDFSALNALANVTDMDKQTRARLDEIETQIRTEQPLTSDRLPLVATLSPEYRDTNGNHHFHEGVCALGKEFEMFRTVRGDGNCFYRAFLYSLAETLLKSPTCTVCTTLLKFVKNDSWMTVISAGYDPDMLEVFHDSLVDLLERLVDGTCNETQMHQEMNEENSTSDYCTWYLRVVSAVHLKMNTTRFLPFLENDDKGRGGGERASIVDMDTFCKSYVEPMGKECEHIQVLALAEALGVQVVIAYLDGHELVNGKVSQHDFGPTADSMKLCFLYRPGHYDVLYPKEQTNVP